MSERKGESEWDKFPNQITVIESLGTLLIGIASEDGQLQATYVLNNVKRLKLQPILEDAE